MTGSLFLPTTFGIGTMRSPSRPSCSPYTRLGAGRMRSPRPNAPDRSGQEGQSLVELALYLPMMAIFIFACFQLAIIFYDYLSVMNAARDIGRWLVVHPHTLDSTDRGGDPVPPADQPRRQLADDRDVAAVRRPGRRQVRQPSGRRPARRDVHLRRHLAPLRAPDFGGGTAAGATSRRPCPPTPSTWSWSRTEMNRRSESGQSPGDGGARRRWSCSSWSASRRALLRQPAGRAHPPAERGRRGQPGRRARAGRRDEPRDPRPPRPAVAKYLTLHGYPRRPTRRSRSPSRRRRGPARSRASGSRPRAHGRPTSSSWSGSTTRPSAPTRPRPSTGALIDIMLSLDLTGSMELSGTSDLEPAPRRGRRLRQQDQPERRRPDRAEGRHGALRRRSSAAGCRAARPTPSSTSARGRASTSGPCTDDKTVLTNLTRTSHSWSRSPTTAAAAPARRIDGLLACVRSWSYDGARPVRVGRVAAQRHPLRRQPGLCARRAVLHRHQAAERDLGRRRPRGTVTTPGAPPPAAGTTHRRGQRPQGAGLMTDGFNELWPTPGNPSRRRHRAWDSEVVSRANTLKLGADGAGGTADDDSRSTRSASSARPTARSAGAPARWPTSRPTPARAGRCRARPRRSTSCCATSPRRRRAAATTTSRSRSPRTCRRCSDTGQQARSPRTTNAIARSG